MDIIVNEETSVVQIDGSQIANLPTVYISTTTIPDHFVTVIDMTGYISTGRQLRISTTEGVQFSDGTTTTYIRQPFGYLSLAARSLDRWSVVNRDPFSVDASTIRALDAITVTAANISSTTLISTAQLQGDTLNLNTISAKLGTFGNPYISGDVINVSSNLNIGTTLEAGSISSTSFNGTDFTGMYATIAGNLEVGGDVSLINMRVNEISTSGLTSLNDHISTTSITASTAICMYASTSSTIVLAIVASVLNIGSTFITEATGSAISTISTAVSTVDTFATVTSTITALTIDGPISTIQLGSAAIMNPRGSLTTSTISATRLLGQTMTGAVTSCGPISTATIAMNTSDPTPVFITYAAGYGDTLNSCWSISTTALNTGTMSTSVASADTMDVEEFNGEQVIVDTLSPTYFTVTDTMTLTGSSFFVPLAPVTADTITTADTNVSTLRTGLITDVVSIVSDTPIYIPNLSTQTIETTHISTQTALVSTGAVQNITLGKPLSLNPNDPSVTIDLLSSLDSPPFQTASGTGTFNDPFKTFNTSNRIINISFNNPSNDTLYLNFKIRHTNLPSPNAGLNGGLFVYINGNLEYVVDNIYEQPLVERSTLDAKLSDYPMQGVNPITGDTSNYYFVWDVVSSTVTTDELTMWISNNENAVDLANPSRLDPSVGLMVNRGVIQWPSTLYTTTIVNEFNDIQTRSLLYTGALSQVSDRALKRNIEDFDMSQCLAAVQTPVYRYAYVPQYASTFHIEDRTRLGILTSELATHFPKSVTPDTVLGEERDVASTDQLRYAHLAATKFLMDEIRRLRQKLLDL